MEAIKTITNAQTLAPAAEIAVQKKDGEQSLTPLFYQPKLTIGSPDDPLEKEADDMADKVMRMEIPQTISFSSSKNTINRKCAHCEEEEKQLQRKESSGRSVSVAPPIVHDVINSSGGRSMDTDTRSFMESRFNYDFSNVKIHDGDTAAKSASSINALAYTSGNNVVFNSGQYNTNSDSGKRLLAHELTHVVQQNNIPSGFLDRKIRRQAVGGVTLSGLTATRVAFNNTGGPDADNCANLLPAALGVDGPAIGQNGMEMIFRINGAIPAGTEFEITRTRAAGLWERNGAAWTRLGGNPAGTNDDHHDQDECVRPVGGRIFVIDTPGLDGSLNPRGVEFLGSGTVGAAATAAVWILSFAEWVMARNRGHGIGWTRISSPELHRWHSIFSTELVGGVWTRVNAPSGRPNEIELGTTRTTGATP